MSLYFLNKIKPELRNDYEDLDNLMQGYEYTPTAKLPQIQHMLNTSPILDYRGHFISTAARVDDNNLFDLFLNRTRDQDLKYGAHNVIYHAAWNNNTYMLQHFIKYCTNPKKANEYLSRALANKSWDAAKLIIESCILLHSNTEPLRWAARMENKEIIDILIPKIDYKNALLFNKRKNMPFEMLQESIVHYENQLMHAKISQEVGATLHEHKPKSKI